MLEVRVGRVLLPACVMWLMEEEAQRQRVFRTVVRFEELYPDGVPWELKHFIGRKCVIGTNGLYFEGSLAYWFAVEGRRRVFEERL